MNVFEESSEVRAVRSICTIDCVVKTSIVSKFLQPEQAEMEVNRFDLVWSYEDGEPAAVKCEPCS